MHDHTTLSKATPCVKEDKKHCLVRNVRSGPAGVAASIQKRRSQNTRKKIRACLAAPSSASRLWLAVICGTTVERRYTA